MTTLQNGPTPTPFPAPPAAPVPVSQQSVRTLWAAVIGLGVGGALYAMFEHPVLVGPLSAVGGILGAVAGLSALLRR